jgi:ribokinase
MDLLAPMAHAPPSSRGLARGGATGMRRAPQEGGSVAGSGRSGAPAPRVAVVGHVEWAEFVRVDRLPAAGEIAHAREHWEGPGGGGAVAAVQVARLGSDALFLTALGDDARGHRAAAVLEASGVRVAAVFRPEPQRRVFVHVDRAGERTITVIGPRLFPRREDPLPWADLARLDAVYVTAADAAGVRAARAARVLTATPRALATLADAGVRLDALIGSARDAGERYRPGDLAPAPALVVRTEGAAGGHWLAADGRTGRWKAVPLDAPHVDTYGAGDSFAAGLTWALGSGRSLDDSLALAAACGARALTVRGPYGTPAPPPDAGARDL